ncbi:hypothetical protein HYH02_011953 [Chlamydomonas schloesseri]|uniref:Hexosyltransferase n=1 Tax=Chlamydomonas schloesseri TaxID=2026947 RepID=A0A835T3T0_9CHLO|nr:hypothetical protein HYH02_011953 [Chlamydomonas schloesseri]|eukprot:KAG2435453.1 hypothetical protein HYH02_011953 [Chlamydomonas schloesseri]
MASCCGRGCPLRAGDERRVSERIGLLACLFLTVTLSAAADDPEAAAFSVSPTDFLVVVPTHHARIGTVYASRSWRKGVRTHIVVDDQVKLDALRTMGLRHNESFSAMPDLPGVPGSLRLVLAPLLAHRKYAGKYKWMLLGDDDTLFSLTAVMAMLREMRVSHTDPLAISDFLVHCRFEADGKRNWKAPVTRDLRCPGAAAAAAAADLAAAAATTAGSSLDGLAGRATATTSTTSQPTRPCMLPPEHTGPPRFREAPDCPPEGQTYFYGGAGIVLSHGLLERLVVNHVRTQPVLVAASDEGREAAAYAAAAVLLGGVGGGAGGALPPAPPAPAVAAVAAMDDASFYAVVMSSFSGYGDTSMSEAWRRAGVGFTPPPPLPYQLLPKRAAASPPPVGAASAAAAAAAQRQLRKIVKHSKVPCVSASASRGGPPPPECRRFAALGHYNEWEPPADILARHKAVALIAPEAFKHIVSAHMRPRNGLVDVPYLLQLSELGKLLASGYAGSSS